MYMLRPHAAGIYTPRPFYTPPPLEGYFLGWGVGVYKIWPRMKWVQKWDFGCKSGSKHSFRPTRKTHFWIFAKTHFLPRLRGGGNCFLKRALRQSRPSINIGKFCPLHLCTLIGIFRMYLNIVSLVIILSNWVCDNWAYRFPINRQVRDSWQIINRKQRRLRRQLTLGKKKEPKPKLFGPDTFGWGSST